MSIFNSRLKYVSCRVWDATRDNFVFPEIGAQPYGIPDLKDRPNVGLAFSGGGTRSASATLGQLRGLKSIGLLSRARYLSCVSGGAWTAVPFTYLPEAWPDETFLGQVVPPGDLAPDVINKTDRNSLAHCIANSHLFDDFLKNALRFAGDETFSRAMGDIFLNAFDIDSLKGFFSCNDAIISTILANNPKMLSSDFYRTNQNRPFLIVNSTLLRTDNKPPLPTRIHFETTPIYTGVKAHHPNAGSGGKEIGGGYIEPFGFDSDEPESILANEIVKVRLGATRYRYTISDVIGASGAAPAEILGKFGLNWVGFPEFKYWSPIKKGDQPAREYEFGDGGILENLGIMPLLMRKVKNIIVFVNTKAPLTGTEKGQINDSIPPLFGMVPDFTTNHVFPKNKYSTLVEGLMEAKSKGTTVMFRDRFPVLKNKHYDIEPGWEADILWVYNERVNQWEEALPKNVRKLIAHGSLGNFPHYKTFFQNPPAVIDLSAKQVALLANLSCWNITANRDVFESMFE